MSFEAFGTPLLVVMVLLAVFAFGFSSVFRHLEFVLRETCSD